MSKVICTFSPWTFPLGMDCVGLVCILCLITLIEAITRLKGFSPATGRRNPLVRGIYVETLLCTHPNLCGCICVYMPCWKMPAIGLLWSLSLISSLDGERHILLCICSFVWDRIWLLARRERVRETGR